MGNLSKEKIEWLKSIGMKEFENPMKYHLGGTWLYSEEYIKSTPLKELKAKYDKRLIQEGEYVTNDVDLDR